MVLPALSLGLVSSALLLRIMRTSMLEVLTSDYIRTAHAKGAPQWVVLTRHALRNALIPFLTVGAVEFGFLFGGVVIIEDIFRLPGIGSLVLVGIINRDYPGPAGFRAGRDVRRADREHARRHLRSAARSAPVPPDRERPMSASRLQPAPARPADARRRDRRHRRARGNLRAVGRALFALRSRRRGHAAGPDSAHWLGTDEVGRDVLSRTIFAAHISVKVALFAVAVGLVGGTIIGMLAAYFGGIVDMALMRLMELLFSFPAILLAVVLMASLGTNVLNAMIAIGIVFIPGFARLARASTLSALRQQYVEAARTIGMSHSRIILRELLPNVVTPLLVEAAVAFAYAVLLESALSFLGLGAQPPEPSWGNMLNTGRGFMAQAPWLSIVPGLALFLCVLGFNLLGDGLRDVLDPHLRD